MAKKKDKELKLVFAPGCFDDFEGTQEELNDLMEHIKESFANGTMLEDAEPVDLTEMIEDGEEDLVERILQNVSDENKRNLH